LVATKSMFKTLICIKVFVQPTNMLMWQIVAGRIEDTIDLPILLSILVLKRGFL